MSRRAFPLLVFGYALLIGAGACSSGDGIPTVEGPTAAKLELSAMEMRYSPSRIAVAAGDVPVVLHNQGLVIHDLRLDKRPRLLVEASPGKTSNATWQLPRGRYRIDCSLPGHRAAGMEGVLEVR
jgi:uncharacterized cupredoxin-like copper-binding protein